MPSCSYLALQEYKYLSVTHQPRASCCHLVAGWAAQTVGSTGFENSAERTSLFVKYSPKMSVFHRQSRMICSLTWAHMRIMSVFVLSQSTKTFTTWINPWLVSISSFSKRVFSLCSDRELCWLPSESESKSRGGDTIAKERGKSHFVLFLNLLKKKLLNKKTSRLSKCRKKEHEKDRLYVTSCQKAQYHFHWFRWQYQGSYRRENPQEEEVSLGRGEQRRK